MQWDLPTVITYSTQAATAIGAGWLLWLRFRKRLGTLDQSLTAAAGMVTVFGPSPAEEIRKRLLELETVVEAMEFRHNVVCERLGIGIYMCGLDARCSYSNPQLASLFALDRDEMLGWGWLSAVSHNDQDRVRESWQMAVKEKLPYREQYRLRSGKVVETEAFLLHNKTAYIGYVITIPSPGPTSLPAPANYDNTSHPSRIHD